jgi:hypothetical protein
MMLTAMRDFGQTICNDNTDSIDDCQKEEASNQNEHCYQVLFRRLGPPKKNNWAAHKKQVDHREHAQKAIPHSPLHRNLQDSNVQIVCHLRGAPNNGVHTARIAIEAALHALYWAVPECGHSRSTVEEAQALDKEALNRESGLDG